MNKQVTSERKISKKAHRLYRRDMKKEAEQLGRTVGNMMKPKPRFIPWPIWMWALGFFIKVTPKEK